MLEVDNEYNKYFIKEDIIEKSEKLPNKIKSVIEKGKIIDKGKNDNIKLNLLIHDCINVENSVKEINTIYELMDKCNSNKKIEIMFTPDDNGINKFIEQIGIFGNIVNSQNFININSKIMTKLDMEKINNWLKESLGDKKIKKYELIYRATEHGDSNQISFQRCKNQPNLLWIMKNKNNNNNIFGCFNSIPTSSDGNYSQDNKWFLFSLTKNKKYYPNLNIGNNIYNCSSHIIEFGNSSKFDFSIGDKFLSSNAVNFSDGQFFNHKNEISDNISSLSLSECEVFKIYE